LSKFRFHRFKNQVLSRLTSSWIYFKLFPSNPSAQHPTRIEDAIGFSGGGFQRAETADPSNLRFIDSFLFRRISKNLLRFSRNFGDSEEFLNFYWNFSFKIPRFFNGVIRNFLSSGSKCVQTFSDYPSLCTNGPKGKIFGHCQLREMRPKLVCYWAHRC